MPSLVNFSEPCTTTQSQFKAMERGFVRCDGCATECSSLNVFTTGHGRRVIRYQLPTGWLETLDVCCTVGLIQVYCPACQRSNAARFEKQLEDHTHQHRMALNVFIP